MMLKVDPSVCMILYLEMLRYIPALQEKVLVIVDFAGTAIDSPEFVHADASPNSEIAIIEIEA
jgi:hypothetical protein